MSVFAAARPDRQIVQRTAAQIRWRRNLALLQSISGSQKLHVTGHLSGLQHLADQHQTADDLSNRTFLVAYTTPAWLESVAANRRNSSSCVKMTRPSSRAPSQLLAVRGSQRSRFGNGQDIHASAAKAHDDRIWDLLICEEPGSRHVWSESMGRTTSGSVLGHAGFSPRNLKYMRACSAARAGAK
ncbi:MAG: hypothetical protein OXQ31_17910 [Spirochaetaceae bacterium]|nr:hypothetical protein [Spirochaetaceae bacterium]